MNNTISIYFIYNDNKVEIQCDDKDKMKDVFKRFYFKVDKVNEKFYFMYNGNKVDEDLTVEQTASNEDKTKKKMELLVFKDDDHIDLSLVGKKNKIIATIIYLGKITKIECASEEKMEVLYKKFSENNSIDINSLYFLYNERIIMQKVGIKEFLNYDGQKSKKIKIFISSENNKLKNIKSKQVICPVCGEAAQIKIKNYKIYIYKCKYHHKTKELNLNEFETSQIINESKIICGKCKEKDKEITYNNLFYICNTCNLNLCPLCKANHNKTHNIINYDSKYFICNIHDEIYNMYCETCNKNICSFCEQEHEDHDTIRLGQLMIKKKDIEKKIKEIKISIDKFKEDIKRIMDILQNVIDNCENFYKIDEELIHSFDVKNRNYQNLKSLKEVNNDDISQKLNSIINSKNYEQKITEIFKIYNLMYNNKIVVDDKSGDTKKLINESQINLEKDKLNSKILSPEEKMIKVIFISEDQKIHYTLSCKHNVKFNDIEQKLYEKYPDYSKTNNSFYVNGRKINESEDLDYNKIENGDIINIHYKEKNKLKKYFHKIFK